jgi:hypothetical protein
VPISSHQTPIAPLSAAATPSRSQEISSTSNPVVGPQTDKKIKNCESVFPQCFPMLYGQLDPTGIATGGAAGGVGGLSDRSTSAAATPRPQQTPRTTVNSGDNSSICICRKLIWELLSYPYLNHSRMVFDTVWNGLVSIKSINLRVCR